MILSVIGEKVLKSWLHFLVEVAIYCVKTWVQISCKMFG